MKDVEVVLSSLVDIGANSYRTLVLLEKNMANIEHDQNMRTILRLLIHALDPKRVRRRIGTNLTDTLRTPEGIENYFHGLPIGTTQLINGSESFVEPMISNGLTWFIKHFSDNISKGLVKPNEKFVILEVVKEILDDL